MPLTETPLQEFTPASSAELSRFLHENFAGDAQAIYPVSGRTSLQFLGPKSTQGTIVSTAKLNQVIDYPARDMTITVEAGMKVGDLIEKLASEGQQLPVDVTHQHRATLGGALACNVSGPRRFGYGTLRDYVIGISAVDAEGRLFSAGGRVVKNVAGYDLCKLLTGSRGTLGVISQVTLKVKPLVEATEAVWCTCETFEDIEKILAGLQTSETRPVALEVLTPTAAKFLVADSRIPFPVASPVLVIFYEGTETELHWQVGQLRQELESFSQRSIEEVGPENSELLLGTLREFPDGGDVPVTFQANLLPSQTMSFLERCEHDSISAISHAGNGIVSGHLPEEMTSTEQISHTLSELTLAANSAGGNLILLAAQVPEPETLNWWGRAEPSWPLMGKIKRGLDVKNLLNPGAIPFV